MSQSGAGQWNETAAMQCSNSYSFLINLLVMMESLEHRRHDQMFTILKEQTCSSRRWQRTASCHFGVPSFLHFCTSEKKQNKTSKSNKNIDSNSLFPVAPCGFVVAVRTGSGLPAGSDRRWQWWTQSLWRTRSACPPPLGRPGQRTAPRRTPCGWRGREAGTCAWSAGWSGRTQRGGGGA